MVVVVVVVAYIIVVFYLKYNGVLKLMKSILILNCLCPGLWRDLEIFHVDVW